MWQFLTFNVRNLEWVFSRCMKWYNASSRMVKTANFMISGSIIFRFVPLCTSNCTLFYLRTFTFRLNCEGEKWCMTFLCQRFDFSFRDHFGACWPIQCICFQSFNWFRHQSRVKRTHIWISSCTSILVYICVLFPYFRSRVFVDLSIHKTSFCEKKNRKLGKLVLRNVDFGRKHFTTDCYFKPINKKFLGSMEFGGPKKAASFLSISHWIQFLFDKIHPLRNF